jgi:hypothetical protein
MSATLNTERVTVPVEQLLDVIVNVISEAMDGRNADLCVRMAIWRVRGEPNWQARIDDQSPTILATFFNAVDYAAARYDLDDDPVYHEATRQLASQEMS